MELQSQTILQGGRYVIHGVLGRGGFGVTYLAEQVMAKRRVCIKEFFPKDYYTRGDDTRSLMLASQGFAASMNRYKEKFVKEAQTIAALDHPNIIPIYDVFEENNTAYYVMEYIDGESLSDVIKRRGALAEGDAVEYIRQAAEALGYLHERRIMHLDIKPGNIMVRRKDNRVVLIDFGLSKHYDEQSGEATSTTPVGVSHGYAPMEQYRQGGVNTFSPETDIYSLGATLYALVVGHAPQEAATLITEPLDFPGHISLSLRSAITAAMAISPKERPASVGEFLAMLNGVGVSDKSENTIIIEKPIETDKKPIDEKPKPQTTSEKKSKRKISLWGVFLSIVVFVISVVVMIPLPEDEEYIEVPREHTEVGVEVLTVDQDSEIDYQTTAPYDIGDYYNENGKEGVVFEVQDGGQHGKIVSMDYTETVWDSRVEWSDDKCKYINGTRTYADSENDGRANTDKIMARSDRNYFPAFTWCRAKGDSWYLPVISELKTIFRSKETINVTLSKHGVPILGSDLHWSSTEEDEFCAWYVDMYYGFTNYYDKCNLYYVRAVSAF